MNSPLFQPELSPAQKPVRLHKSREKQVRNPRFIYLSIIESTEKKTKRWKLWILLETKNMFKQLRITSWKYGKKSSWILQYTYTSTTSNPLNFSERLSEKLDNRTRACREGTRKCLQNIKTSVNPNVREITGDQFQQKATTNKKSSERMSLREFTERKSIRKRRLLLRWGSS